MRNPYDVLGVAKTATAKEIKSAYRKLAKKHHPDQNPDDAKAKDRFAVLNQAYEILGDEKLRGAFDRGEIDAEGKPLFAGFETAGGQNPFARQKRTAQGPGGMRYEFRSGGPQGPFGGGDASDLFSEIFGQAFGRGGPEPQPARGSSGPDMTVNADVTIEEAAGEALKDVLFPDGRRVAVKLPAFVEDGQEIRLKGQGGLIPGGMRGDAVVRLRFRRHPRYTVDGRDLHADLPVSLRDAVLGAKLPVETIGGRVAVTVPAWSSSGRALRIKGRGLPLKAGGRGDLYVHVQIALPEGGDAELEQLMRRRGA